MVEISETPYLGANFSWQSVDLTIVYKVAPTSQLSTLLVLFALLRCQQKCQAIEGLYILLPIFLNAWQQ